MQEKLFEKLTGAINWDAEEKELNSITEAIEFAEKFGENAIIYVYPSGGWLNKKMQPCSLPPRIEIYAEQVTGISEDEFEKYLVETYNNKVNRHIE